MIIKCPACQTKFAVDQALLQAVSRPRFQCSQCGKYFEGSQAETNALSESSDRCAPEMSGPTIHGSSPEQLSLLERSAEPQNSQQISKAPIPFPNPAATSPSWPSSFKTPAQHQTPEPAAFKSVELAQPTLSTPTKPVVEKRLLSNFTDKVAAWPESNAQPSFTPAFTPEVEDKADTPEPTQDADQKSNRIRRSYKRKRTSRLKAETSSPVERMRAAPDSHRGAFRSSPPLSHRFSFFKPHAALIIVPILVFAALYTWSQNLENTPQAISALLALENDETLQVPPMTGLEVIDTSSQLIVLDDGTKLLEIKGSVLNSTVQSFYEIQLEAKTYDVNNNVLNTKIVPATNGLTNAAEVRSLRHSSIKALQRKAALGNAEIKPNSSADFRLMLKSSPQMAWYSVRVYSVGQPR